MEKGPPMKTNKILAHLLSSFVWLVSFLVVAVATPLQAQAPVGYWKFDEGSGTRAADSSGNAHTALLSNGVSWVRGTKGGAILANAANRDSVAIPAIDLSGTHAVTIAFWAKRTYSTDGKDVLFEATGNYQNSTTGFVLLPDDETCHGIQAALRGNEGTTANCYSQPSSGVWHHIALVLDKSQTGGDAVAFYVDGVLQTPSWNLSAATNTNNFGQDPMYLFSRGGTSQFSSGAVDDLRVYNRSLTAAQIQQVYKGSQSGLFSPSGLVAAYAFSEGSGSTVADASGNGNTGTISNATWTTAGKYGNALVFNGTNALVTVNDAASLHLTTAMTLEAWVKPSVVNNAWRDVIYKGNDNYFLEATSDEGGVPGAGATLGSSDVVTFGTSVLGTNAWTHLAMTYDGDALLLYVNGVLVSNLPQTGNIATSANPLQIGGDSIFGQYFSGVIDEIRVYNTTLTQGEIQSDMNTPVGLTLVSIAVTPANPSIMIGAHQQFTATGTYSDGSRQDLTNSATWTSSVPSVATISSTGLATGVAAGSTAIQATSGSIHGTTTLTVTAEGSFTISASPPSLSIVQGSPGTSTITTTASGSFNSSISLSATGMPTGTTASFNPSTIPAPGSGNSTMTITVGASTPVGTYPITVTGDGGGIQRTATVTLTVTTAVTTINYVQGNYATPQTPQTTVNVVFTAAQVAGDLNVVVVGWNDSTATVSTVTDSNGNVYAPAVGPTVQSGLASQSIYYAKNIASATAGSNTVSVRFTSAAVSPDIRILEYSGADLDNPVDVTAANSGNSASSSSGSATTTSATDLILGANLVQTITSGPGNGFTTRLLTQPDGDIAEDEMVTATGSYSATAPVSPSGPWIMQMVAFRSASGGGPTLVSIAVTPVNPSITVGGQQQFTATGTYSDGSRQDLTNSATWTSSIPSIATISSTGLATGVAAGTTTIQATSGSIYGTTALTVTGTGTFTVSASPSSLSIGQGSPGTSTITTTVSGGFNSSISLSATGMPTGTTVSFNPSTIPAPGSGSSTMTITVGASTPAGTYPITVTGNGGGIQRTTIVTLTVTTSSDFTISASPTALSVMQGSLGTSTITTAVSGGFSSSISLSATGVPAGTTVSFNPTTIPAPGAGNSTMTITVGLTTPMGTYPITVTGTASSIQHAVTVNLTVTAEINLSWTASSSPGIAGYNAYRGTTSGGPYAKINTGLISSTTYSDLTVHSGLTYYYVTTAVSNQGMESSYSNEASASVP
jgi:Concanavalin A-like lectin/glucanases superfamily/Bacterial Ig-like domain (group 2)